MLLILKMCYKWQKGTYRNKEAWVQTLWAAERVRVRTEEIREGQRNQKYRRKPMKTPPFLVTWCAVGEALQLNQTSLRALSFTAYEREKKGRGFLEKCISTQWSLWFLPLHICRVLTSFPYPRRHSHFFSFTSAWKAEGDEALLGSLINLICGKPCINHWFS